MKQLVIIIFFTLFATIEVRACSCPAYSVKQMLSNGAVSFSGWLISLDTVEVYERTARDRGLSFWKSRYVVSRRSYGRARLLIDTAYYSKFELPDTISILWPLGGDCAGEFYPPFVADAVGRPELNHYFIFAYQTSPYVPRRREGLVEHENDKKLISTNFFKRDFCFGNIIYSRERESELFRAVNDWKKMSSER